MSFIFEPVGKSWSSTVTGSLTDWIVLNVRLTAGVPNPTFALSSWEIIIASSAKTSANIFADLTETRQ